MSVRLQSIAESEFQSFLEALLHQYAESRASADRVSIEEAEAFARRQYEALLPEGLATPGHDFLRILDDRSGQHVGSLWLYVDLTAREAFIYDITVLSEYRRRGLASEAIRLAENRARAAGCRRIALNVFAANKPAQVLYKKLGYCFVSHHMNKPL